MQKPTMQNVRIRSTRDAHQIFLGVARNVLPLITRRLDAEERRAIRPGNVYVWEERGNNSEATGLGMERWTDGMGWGPSRVRDEFLFYHQKESDVNEDPNNPATPWVQMINMSPRSRSMSDSERLIKQTYSVHVSLPPDRAQGITRKWHITAYFSQQKLDSLFTIDTVRGVGDVHVPEGIFRSGRAGKSRGRDGDLSRMTGPALDSFSGVRDPPSFSAFYSTPPDAAIQYLYPTPGSYLPSSSQIMNTKVATSVRHRTPKSPDVASSSHAREQYREQSNARYPSSNSPSPTDRSRTNSGSKSSSPSPSAVPANLASHLVPLEYLQNVTSPRREPVDEQLLRRFSTQSVSLAVVPQCELGSKSPIYTQLPASSSDQSAARHAPKNRYGGGWDASNRPS